MGLGLVVRLVSYLYGRGAKVCRELNADMQTFNFEKTFSGSYFVSVHIMQAVDGGVLLRSWCTEMHRTGQRSIALPQARCQSDAS